MGASESELREQYRNASDEDLSFLAGQGESRFTDMAWALLRQVTAGLYWPFAAIALARYRIESIHVESEVPLSALASGVQASVVTAAGEGAADAFGADVGL